MFDINQNLVLNVGNSWCNMIRNQSHRFSGLNPNVLHHGESSRLVFLLPFASASDAIDNSLNRLDALKRQGEMNNRVNSPRSGKLADYTRKLVTWVIVQASYRIEQLAMLNVVKIKYLMALRDYIRASRLISPLYCQP